MTITTEELEYWLPAVLADVRILLLVAAAVLALSLLAVPGVQGAVHDALFQSGGSGVGFGCGM